MERVNINSITRLQINEDGEGVRSVISDCGMKTIATSIDGIADTTIIFVVEKVLIKLLLKALRLLSDKTVLNIYRLQQSRFI